MIWPIERRHFQWPWTTPNLIFKVTPFFDTEYLTNGYRYGQSYYRRRIGNRTQAFEWHQFQWHLVTSNADFKVTTLFNVKNSKMVRDRTIFTMATNRKSHTVYRTATFSVTLKDSKPRFQGQAILWHCISQKWLQIRPYLLWKANRKPYPSFQMVPLSITLSDL